MAPTIEVSSALLDRLESLAGPLFSPSDVIERLINQAQPNLDPGNFVASIGAPGRTHDMDGSGQPPRAPRSRGAEIEINGQRMTAVSVPDMYLQVLKLLVDEKHIEKLDPRIPFKTSNQRYLIAKSPVHPNSNQFVKPVEYRGYFMEAHKNYENAMSGLSRFLRSVGIKIRYV